MKSTRLIFACVCAIALSTLSSANALDKNKPRILLGLDYFHQGHVESSIDEQVAADSEIVLSETGIPEASQDAEGGFGLRAGVLFPVKSVKNFWVGGSVGYVFGPKIEGIVDDFTYPQGRFKTEVDNSYIRGLIEVAQFIPCTDVLWVKLGAGIGIGKGKTEQSFLAEGYYEGWGNSSATKSSTGLTWEISPALVIEGEKLSWELGLRYAQFPTIKESDSTYEIDFDSIGLYSAIGF